MTSTRQESTEHITLLDCTFRDGGYYNDWDFPPAMMREYADRMAQTGVDVLEMGFRMGEAVRFLGPAAYTTDQFLHSLDIPQSVRVAVMVDAKQLLVADDPVCQVRTMFAKKSDSRVDLVRVACTLSEVETVMVGVAELLSLGYAVGLNLMQIASYTPEQIGSFGSAARTVGVEVAYFADSFGSLTPDRVPEITSTLRETFQGPIGCHFHDNLKCALANSRAAIDAGATWVDGTILGMGRGPGNARIEDLLTILSQGEREDLNVLPVMDLIGHYFRDLEQRFGWGSNPYYVLSGLLSVHPTYVVEFLKDDRFSPPEIIDAIQRLGSAGGSRYGRDRYDEAMSPAIVDVEGTTSIAGWAEGRDVAIVAAGPSTAERRSDIEAFIRYTKPLVIILNADVPIEMGLVDAIAACQPMMIAAEAIRLTNADCAILAPSQLLIELGINDARVMDVGVRVTPGSYCFDATTVSVPVLLVAAYAFAVVAAANAQRILLIGFDGFPLQDPRQNQMIEVIEAFVSTPGAPELIALTPTEYPVRQSSLYAPSWAGA